MIELNQKMLILKRFVTKNDFLCDMTTELFIKYFCSIKLCCLWRFDEKLFVFKYCFIFIVLVLDTSTHCSMKMLILIRFVAICFMSWVNKTDFVMAEREWVLLYKWYLSCTDRTNIFFMRNSWWITQYKLNKHMRYKVLIKPWIDMYLAS